MKVYVVTVFKKDKDSGYNLPCKMEVFSTRESAEAFASSFDAFTTVTNKHLHD